MSSCYGTLLRLSIFGQSHSAAIGMSLDGLPAGEAVNLDALQRLEHRAEGERRPGVSLRTGGRCHLRRAPERHSAQR